MAGTTMNQNVIHFYQQVETATPYHQKRYQSDMGRYRIELIKNNLRKIIDRSDLNQRQVLEVAPGSGVITQILLKLFPQINLTALDSSPSMIAFLQKNVPKKIKLLTGDARKLPFKANTFDAIFAMRLLIHYRQPPDILNEFFRVLKPGGFIVVDAHNFFRLDILNCFVRRFINPKGLFGVQRVDSYYLFPWEIKSRYAVKNSRLQKIIGHKFIPPLPLLYKVMGHNLIFKLERILSDSWLKFFAFDSYIQLYKPTKNEKTN